MDLLSDLYKGTSARASALHASAAPGASAAYKAVTTIWGLFFLVSVLIYTVSPGDDPYRCRSLLTTGRWVDAPDENGDRLPFKQWQADNCMLHDYKADDIVQCVGNNSILISGDSTYRQTAEAIVRKLEIPNEHIEKFVKSRHADWQVPYRNLTLKFVWNPYIQSEGHWNIYEGDGDYSNLTVYAEQLALYREEEEKGIPSSERKSPSLFLVGGGIWFVDRARDSDEMEVEWIQKYHDVVTKASTIYPEKSKNLFTAPMDPEEGMGNQLFFIPPTRGSVTGYDEKRWSLHDKEQRILRGFQQWLRDHEKDLNFHMAWAVSQVVEGQNKTIDDAWGSGWHYIDSVSEMRGNIMLNYRCNAKLARQRWPINGTCCTDYGYKPATQSILLWSSMILLVVCLTLELREMLKDQSRSRLKLLNMRTGGAMVLPLLMSYFADRTQMMGKGEKVLEHQSVAILCIIWAIIALLSVRRVSIPSSSMRSDEAFLQQNQMNEWKGLVHLMLISISWANHQSVLGSIVMAILGSSFLFQLAYEHTAYFLATRDYSYSRMANVLLRLNLFTALLSHFTSTSYINYQYIMLASVFFFVVWATTAFRQEELNGDMGTIFAKVVASIALLTVIVKFTPIIKFIAFILQIYNIHWDIEVLESYISQDLYISYAGMLLAAANHHHILNKSLAPKWIYSFGVISFMILGFYWSTWSQEGLKISDYMQSHSMTSVVPILAYLCLRNISATTRSYYSAALEWVGGCSLELYVLHFHLFLANNARGVLLTGAFTGDGSLANDRWRDLILIASIFLLAGSLATAGVSNFLEMIFPTSPRHLEPGPMIQSTTFLNKDFDDIYDVETEKPVPSPILGSPINDTSNTGTWKVPLTKIYIASSTVTTVSLFLVLAILNVLTPADSLLEIGTEGEM